jgi:hypothetical protein
MNKKSKKEEYKEKKEFNGRILPNILEFNVNIDAQLISKSNFIFGASTLILVFILNNIISNQINILSLKYLPLTLLLVGSFMSSLISILIILPKLRIISKKERIKEDVFYYKNIITSYSREEYIKYLKELPKDDTKSIEAYSNQIYSLAKNIIPYKFKLLKIAGWTLITSIFLSIFLYIINSIIL